MAQRHSGLTPAIAGSYTEAAKVCFDRHHEPPTTFEIRWSEQQSEQHIDAAVEWETTDQRTRGGWNNEVDATRDGAYACILAAVELVCGLVAVRRAETGTGADYYVAPTDTSADDLEDYIRVEVSGTDRESASGVARRLREKLDQAKRGDSDLPAIAGVVGFRARLIHLASLEES